MYDTKTLFTGVAIGAACVGAFCFLYRESFLKAASSFVAHRALVDVKDDLGTEAPDEQKKLLRDFILDLKRTAEIIATEGTEAGVSHLEESFRKCEDRERLVQILEQSLPSHLFKTVIKKLFDNAMENPMPLRREFSDQTLDVD